MKELLTRYPALSECKENIEAAVKMLIDCYEDNGKVLLCGNGGSSADCDHIVGELAKGFLKLRPLSTEVKEKMKANCPQIEDSVLNKLQGGLPAISLPSFTALNSAFCNDVDPTLIYAQGVLALSSYNDVLIAMSTSGNSKNVVFAATVAKSLGIKVIALTGKSGGTLRNLADICICAPEDETYKIQEFHLPIYHYICAEIEKHFFN